MTKVEERLEGWVVIWLMGLMCLLVIGAALVPTFFIAVITSDNVGEAGEAIRGMVTGTIAEYQQSISSIKSVYGIE